MPPALVCCSTLEGASNARCWVHELGKGEAPSNTLLYNLSLMTQQGKLAAVGVLRAGGRVAVVIKLHRRETKQNARNTLEKIYEKHAPGWTAPGLEALDAFHVSQFNWTQPGPTDERVRKAAAAAREDGVDGLREQLPALRGVDEKVLKDWVKGGLLSRILTGYLDGLPALTDCPHELRRHCFDAPFNHLGKPEPADDPPKATCERCHELSRLEWSCTKCQMHTDDCKEGCVCKGRWCYQCGLRIKCDVYDAENVAEGVALIQEAADGSVEEEAFDLYEDADFGGCRARARARHRNHAAGWPVPLVRGGPRAGSGSLRRRWRGKRRRRRALDARGRAAAA